MISVNLSHDTLLPPGDEGQALKRALGLETRRVDFELTDENGVTSARSAEFVQTERRGSFPHPAEPAAAAQGDACQDQLCDDPFERGVRWSTARHLTNSKFRYRFLCCSLLQVTMSTEMLDTCMQCTH
jgi:hypothetical protein